MKFDFAIGNPPYQNNIIGGNDKYAPSIYNLFLDRTYQISDIVSMIHPARFLFNAGSTPKEWNQKMLNDRHLKIWKYEQNSSKIFLNTDIKGGIAITYRNTNKKYMPIKLFTSHKELNDILSKVGKLNELSLNTIMYHAESYRFRQVMHDEYPEIENKNLLSKDHKYYLKSNVLEKLHNIVFFDRKILSDDIGIIGRKNNKRIEMYINNKYINAPENLNKYKVLIPNANGTGAIGKALKSPLVAQPLIGHTQTFLSIGAFDDRTFAENCMKYIKSKFARTLLGILKVTQANPKAVWEYVPLQDFSNDSDIDWSKSIEDIDRQLYKKYDLNDEEIDFIESNIAPMS